MPLHIAIFAGILIAIGVIVVVRRKVKFVSEDDEDEKPLCLSGRPAIAFGLSFVVAGVLVPISEISSAVITISTVLLGYVGAWLS